MSTKVPKPTFVAHRGYPARYPENTLPGLEAAVRYGAKAVEFDVQLTADRVPVLFHDEDLKRVTGESGSILEIKRPELGRLSACEPRRFGRRFAGTAVATLQQALALLAPHEEVEIFVEVKRQSLKRFGVEYTTERIVREFGDLAHRCIVTSFDRPALDFARRAFALRIAWVMSDHNNASRTVAGTLKPEFLLCDLEHLPDTETALWPGPWHWMPYVTNDPRCALKWHRRGAAYIETNDIGGMIKSGYKTQGLRYK